jgi:hypothetical protein
LRSCGNARRVRRIAAADRCTERYAVVTFRMIAPTVFESTDGYLVKGRDRDTIEYVEGPKSAIVGVEFGIKSVCIFRKSVTGWLVDGQQTTLISEAEKERVVERVSAGMSFGGLLVERSPR